MNTLFGIKRKTVAVVALLAIAFFTSPASAQVGSKKGSSLKKPAEKEAAKTAFKNDSMAVFGMYTPIRFNRGQLDDYIPASWNLEFFSTERTGLHKLMQGLFTGLLTEEVEDTDIVQPATFERLEHNIYRKTYSSIAQDPNARFNWPKVGEYCKMLNVRYALFGDITKLDIDKKKNTVNMEMLIHIYDYATQSVIFTQTFSNNGQLADEYGYNTLRRMHKKTDPDFIEFMRTDVGRAATVIFNSFLTKLEESQGAKPDGDATGDTGSTPTRPGPGHEDDPYVSGSAASFPSSYKCTGSGDALALTTINGAALLSCSGKTFKVVQIKERLMQGSSDIPWPAVGQFQVRGRPVLALSATDRWDDDVVFFAAKGTGYNFTDPALTIKADAEGFGQGAFIAAGDFNGDLKDDLALVSQQNGNTVIYSFKADGTTTAIQEIENPFDNYSGPVFPAAGDFNGDGTDELVLSRGEGNDEVIILKSINGKLLTTNPYSTFNDVFENFSDGAYAAAGDLDGDGKDELILSKSTEASDLIIFKNARGRLTATDEIYSAMGAGVTSGGVFPAVGDFDGDGKDEVAITHVSRGGGARILKYINGKLDSLNPMAEIDNVFPNGADGMLCAAGPFTPLWRK